jgi:hypothetical protein
VTRAGDTLQLWEARIVRVGEADQRLAVCGDGVGFGDITSDQLSHQLRQFQSIDGHRSPAVIS